MLTARKKLGDEIAAILQKEKHSVLHQWRQLGKAEKDDDIEIDLSEIGTVTAPYLKSIYKESGSIGLGKLDVNEEDLVDVVFDRAVEYSKARSAELVTGVSDTTKDGIRRIIANGLADNIGRDEIAQNLEDAYEFSSKRAGLIADTEIGNANGMGSLEGLNIGAETGLDLLKEWYPDDEACPICLGNADDGPIPLDEPFSSGDDAPLAHPNCECSLLGVVKE